MIIKETHLKDCLVITPTIFSDTRGYFFESFNQQQFEKLSGLKVNFIQDNQSLSSFGVLRGFHFQTGAFEQAKLVRVIKGKILDVCVDLRKDSKTFGQHYSIILDDIKNEQLFIPRGMAHGFLALEDTVFTYQCDNYYNMASESGILYNDSDLAINWEYNNKDLIVSEKDKRLSIFNSIIR